MLEITDIIKTNGPTRYLHNISPEHERIYLLLSSSWNVFKSDHILGLKASLNRCRKIEIEFCVPSDHDGLKLDTNRKLTD